MFNKKYFFILLLFIVAAGFLTGVCASDVNETGEMAVLSDNIDVLDETAALNGDGIADTADNLAIVNVDNSSDITYDEVLGDDNSTKKPDSIIKMSQSGKYYDNKVVKAKLTDLNGNPLPYMWINFEFYDEYNVIGQPFETCSILTNGNGVAIFRFDDVELEPDTYRIRAVSSETVADSVILNNVKVSQRPATIKASSWKTTYKSGKTFNIRLVDNLGRGVKGLPMYLEVSKNGKKYKVVKSYYLKTSATGHIKCKLSGLDPGNYRVWIDEDTSDYMIGKGQYSFKSKAVSVKINKQPLNIITKSVYNKKSGSVHIKVINKATKKAVDGIKLILKVYTGSRYRTYSVVTGYDKNIYKSHGMAAIETNQLPVGNHRVVITVSNKYCQGSAVANLKILPTVKFFAKYTGFLSYGKKILNL